MCNIFEVLKNLCIVQYELWMGAMISSKIEYFIEGQLWRSKKDWTVTNHIFLKTYLHEYEVEMNTNPSNLRPKIHVYEC